MILLCPADDTPLVASASAGYGVHCCTQCLGVAVAGSVLPAVRAHAALALHQQPDQPARVRPCPHDGKMMKPLPYKGIEMDVCPDCRGLWLEAGQLPRLLEKVQIAAPVNLGRLADGTEIRQEKSTSNWWYWLEDIWVLGDLIGFVFKLWK